MLWNLSLNCLFELQVYCNDSQLSILLFQCLPEGFGIDFILVIILDGVMEVESNVSNCLIIGFLPFLNFLGIILGLSSWCGDDLGLAVYFPCCLDNLCCGVFLVEGSPLALCL